MRYVYTRDCFVGDEFRPIGTVVDALVQPEHTVPAASYKPFAPKIEPVPRAPGFALSIECDMRRTRQPGPDRRTHDRPIGSPTATRLVGVNPHEWRR